MRRVFLLCWPLLMFALMPASVFCEESKAEVVKPETFYLVPSSQVIQEPLQPLPAPLTTAPAVPSEQRAAIPAPNALLTVLESPAFITFACTVAVFVLKFLDDRQKLDASKWTGLVYKLYNIGEQAGIARKLPGHEKLQLVMGQFDDAFERVYGYRPSRTDRADMENDLAAVAYDDETTLNARIRSEMRALPIPSAAAAA